MQGYKAQWSANNTVLNCVPAAHQVPTHIIVGVVAAAAVLIIALLAWWQYLTTRPRWLRERILQVCSPGGKWHLLPVAYFALVSCGYVALCCYLTCFGLKCFGL